MSKLILLVGTLLVTAMMLAQSPPVPHVTPPPVPQVTQKPPLPPDSPVMPPEDEAVPITPETMPIEASYEGSASQEFQNILQRRMGEGSASHIHVALAGDESVTLTGSVPLPQDRARAGQIARSLSGGHAVNNQLAVRRNAQPAASEVPK
jgi:hypothetical protein